MRALTAASPGVQFKERPYTQADQWSDIEAMRNAVTAALEAAACQRSEIDLIIFTGCEKCAPSSSEMPRRNLMLGGS
jgi:3-oxoacyl-[acyl-carrier-protein] synthase III